MKRFLIISILLLFCGITVFAQEYIPMKYEKTGIYTIPCEVNGLKLRFVFDTGASDVSLSLLEAAFMLKNGYIQENDFVGSSSYSLADGSIEENAIVNLRELKIGSFKLTNVKACVSSKISASLLLGQSAIKKLGKYSIDGNNLILYPSVNSSNNNISYERNADQKNKDIYQGDLKNGLKHGRGKMQYANGNVYDGYWENDTANGYGTFYWVSGSTYEGNFKNGYRDGKGTYTWDDGEKYEGQWLKNKRNGYGTHHYSNGNKFIGNWFDSNRSGQGVLYYADGRKYAGEWLNDKQNGKGVFTWPSGDKYDGYMVDNLREGKGIYTWSNGDKYEGEWKHNHQDGYGTYYYSNGNKFIGYWKNGKRNGKGTMYYAGGSTSTGIWENDKKIDYDASNTNLVSQANSASNIYITDKYDGYYEEDDVDYYVAYTTSKTYLLDAPSPTGRILATLPIGTAVFFSSKYYGEDYTKALYIDKDISGYIDKKQLSKYEKIFIDENGVFQVVGKNNYNSKAEIEIENRVNNSVTISVGNQTYKFKAKEKRKIDISPGTYTIRASSPGVIPYIGKDKVEGGYTYSWYFYIQKSKK